MPSNKRFTQRKEEYDYWLKASTFSARFWHTAQFFNHFPFMHFF